MSTFNCACFDISHLFFSQFLETPVKHFIAHAQCIAQSI